MYPEFVPLRINLNLIWLKCFGKKHVREMRMCTQRYLMCLDFPLTLQPGSCFHVAPRTLCKLLAAISKSLVIILLWSSVFTNAAQGCPGKVSR